MKYDVLYNFISPVTGRLPIQEGYILIGDSDGFSIKSPILIDMRLNLLDLRRDVNDIFDTSFIIGFPNINFPQAQVLSKLEDGFMYNTAGVVSTSATIPLSVLPDLTYENLWIGNGSNRPEEIKVLPLNNLSSLTKNYLWTGDTNNRPVETETLIVDNLPNLFYKAIWRGSLSGRPEATEDLTELEFKVTLIENVRLPAIEAELIALDAAIVALEAEIAAVAATATAAEATAVGAAAAAAAAAAAIVILQIEMLTKASIGDVNSAVNSAINGLTLNNINTTGDIDVKNNQITNLATPTLPSAAVPLSFMQAFVAAAIAAIPPGNVNLQGDIITIGAIGGITYTQFNVTRDFDVTSHKLVNVKSPEIETDGVNLDFEWNLLQDEVNITWQ